MNEFTMNAHLEELREAFPTYTWMPDPAEWTIIGTATKELSLEVKATFSRFYCCWYIRLAVHSSTRVSQYGPSIPTTASFTLIQGVAYRLIQEARKKINFGDSHQARIILRSLYA